MEREVTNATEELSHITTMNKPVRHRAATDMGGGASTSRWKHESISQHSRSLWVSIVIAMVLVAICEIGFFNLGHWRTTGLQHATVGKMMVGDGLEALGGNRFRITDPEHANITVPVSDNGRPANVQSLRVVTNATEKPGASIHASIQLKTTGGDTVSRNEWVDGRDSDGAWQDNRHTLSYSANPASQYYLMGKKLQTYESTDVRITFMGAKGDVVNFDRVEVNPVIPFRISLLRLAIELVVAAFFVLFRPTSRIYRMGVDLRSGGQRLATAGFIVGLSALSILVSRVGAATPAGLNDAFLHIIDPNQYQHLADALIHGRLMAGPAG